MKFRYIVFDLDGTLLDTLEDLTDSINYVLGAFSFPLRTVNEVRSFVGNGNRKLVERALPQGTDSVTFEKAFSMFREYYPSHSQIKTAPYPGITELVDALDKAGVMMAVATNKPEKTAEALCNKLFGGKIRVTVGQREGMPIKPDPAGVHLAMELLGAKAGETVYIGDSEVDVQTAHNAGLPCIGAEWGFRGRAVLEENASEYIVSSASQIADIILG